MATNTIKNLNLDTKLTLKQFLELFNDDGENRLWDQFMVEYFDYRTNDFVDDETYKKIESNNFYTKILPRTSSNIFRRAKIKW